MLRSLFSRIFLSLAALGGLLPPSTGFAAVVVNTPVVVTSSNAIAKAAREQREREVAVAAVATPRSAPCWYQVPGRMQLVNLNLAQEVTVAVAQDGMQEVSIVMPVRGVRFSVPEAKAAKLLPELLALTQACSNPS